MAVDPGDSVGPVIDPQGEVIGMVRAVRVRPGSWERVVGECFAFHVDHIRDALSGLDAGLTRFQDRSPR